MRIVPALHWTLVEEAGQPEPLDARLLPLLEAVAASASLAAAVAECGISYRAAWGLLREYEGKLAAPLVLLERGRGAALTVAGQRMLDAQRTAAERLAPILPGLATEIGPQPRLARTASTPHLRVAASHDLALAVLGETLLRANGVHLELSFMGSLHALEAYAAGDADLAGFHVPIAGCGPLPREPFLRWLRIRRDRLVRFVDRDQGLILPRGNPAQVGHFRDIAAKRQRFVNRQRGSGTRLLIDRLMTDGGVAPSTIEGYRTEEFTHAAVAAMVASGGADAAFGLRAAAAEYRLAFVPLVRERYFLALRASALKTPPISRLLQALRGAAFARMARSLSGYETSSAGSVLSVDALRAALREDPAIKRA